MGIGYSKAPGKGYVSKTPFTGVTYESMHDSGPLLKRRAGWWAQRKCTKFPRYADMRGWALTKIYGIPPSMLDKYPPSVYSADMARADIEACGLGRDLPHFRRVVRYDKVSRGFFGDPRNAREYALTKYHGYTRREVASALQFLPYTDKMAQVDISYHATHGRPYYKVVKHTSQVIDTKRGVYRNWRHRGFENRYKYDHLNTYGDQVAKLNDTPEHRFNKSKYRHVTKNGVTTYFIPCHELPGMCHRGDKEFPWVESTPGLPNTRQSTRASPRQNTRASPRQNTRASPRQNTRASPRQNTGRIQDWARAFMGGPRSSPSSTRRDSPRRNAYNSSQNAARFPAIFGAPRPSPRPSPRNMTSPTAALWSGRTTAASAMGSSRTTASRASGMTRYVANKATKREVWQLKRNHSKAMDTLKLKMKQMQNKNSGAYKNLKKQYDDRRASYQERMRKTLGGGASSRAPDSGDSWNVWDFDKNGRVKTKTRASDSGDSWNVWDFDKNGKLKASA